MKKITKDKLKKILEKHKLWLENNPEGEKADLKHVDLSYASLSEVNLSHADLSCANLSDTDLRRADLSYANLIGADLSYANLTETDLRSANLSCIVTRNIKGKDIISLQADTTKEKNIMTHWVDLGVITTGCFQGTIKELKEQIRKAHKDNDFLRNKYESAIAFIENEANKDKIRRIKND